MKEQKLYDITKRNAASIALRFIIFAFIIGCFTPVVESLLKDRLKITIPLFSEAFGIILSVLSWSYVKDVIEDAIESDVNKKKKEIEEEYQKKSPEAIQEKQEQEFLAIWLDKKDMSAVNFNGMSTNVRQEFLKDRNEFESVYLRNFEERYYARQEILANLLQNDGNLLLRLARSAGDYIFQKKNNERINDEQNKIYFNIYTILRGWLLCSIKFDCVMPVQSIHKIIKDSNYEIDALKYIRDTLLNDPEKSMKILLKEKSRDIFKEYISEFIKEMDKVTR